ncbi:leucyl/phenylalanyl-tRNA--protein transferase [Paraliomyxa miuraensis]|uniref:leucyl/phenylalanyl-tRNA--protein transferase n=1 Tax=Paraliomyxa miuraensis TaxID=376150 RepID=UPI002250B223|nr:leucyl/phenylalanyl-tRNA--protein transferase [Paraliomyxa miuraensis]MCX4245192.1 leucyl/phenylalanyl-tRNA--protein transferase [Paraliomyxa miuraensis]
MPVYALTDEISFPPPELARDDGLLAVGGDLSPERLVLAYASGIFPWTCGPGPILWWCPSPRFVLLPDELHLSRSLRKQQRRAPYRLSLDEAFPQVIRECANQPRPGQRGTWIDTDMQAAYTRLHALGLAHSAEAWEGSTLVGGLYGVALGSVFFGESMFARRPDASKLAFAALVEQLSAWGFSLVDCQMQTEHLERFGARDIPLEEFLATLDEGIERPTRQGRWRFDGQPPESAAPVSGG